MPPLRSRTVTHGRNMAGARALWRATGMTNADFGKPIVAVANSFTQFVPGHVHLRDVGRIVAESVAAAGGVGREFNTIAVDDGIAMGHGGINAMSAAADATVSDDQLGEIERSACPTCGSCSGMFTANSISLRSTRILDQQPVAGPPGFPGEDRAVTAKVPRRRVVDATRRVPRSGPSKGLILAWSAGPPSGSQ